MNTVNKIEVAEQENKTNENNVLFLNACEVLFNNIMNDPDDFRLVASQYAILESYYRQEPAIAANCVMLFDDIGYTLNLLKLFDFPYEVIDTLPSLSRVEKFTLLKKNISELQLDVNNPHHVKIFRKEQRFLNIDDKYIPVSKVYDKTWGQIIYKENDSDNYYLSELIWQHPGDREVIRKISFEEFIDLTKEK